MEVTSSQAFDAMGTPLPRGLYDPRLGPYDSFGASKPCPTCGCLYASCPGHSGVMELCVPVYHPILFPLMVKLLRTKCLACHQFKMEPLQLKKFQAKFVLLQQGKLQACLELDQTMAQLSKMKSGTMLQRMSTGKGASTTKAKASQKQKDLTNATGRMESYLEDILEDYVSHPNDDKHKKPVLTSYERSTVRALQKEFISHCLTAKKCPHCGAFSPKVRQDSSNKIFLAPLANASKRINEAEGIVLRSALRGGDNVDEDDDDYGESTADILQENEDKSIPSADKFMHALEVEAQFRRTWDKHPALCSFVFGGPSPDIYFLRAIPVPPSRFRPPMIMGSMTVENSQNLALSKMLVMNDQIRTLMYEQGEELDDADGDADDEVQKNKNAKQARAFRLWIELQTIFNVHLDSSKDPAAGPAANNGIRQILEKKEGIFRKHMMGKRVDYACRSVISPDPYVGTNEIGLPLHFARTLTYPSPVNHRNIEEMRNLVVRGPTHYPGASWVQFPDGRRIELAKMDINKREGIAARLLTLFKRGGPPPIVGRQMRNGDMVLVNRQPTLHKPGIMAHSVRVLHNPTQKTIRMHYANCNTYNADFDGDEMNCHFPQNDIALAEAKYICSTDLQYIVPTDGSPLRGLIQDHVDAGVKMCCKDTFLKKWQVQQLIFAALTSLSGLEVIRDDTEIELLPPAIIRPKQLWTGKQVISILLNHLRKGCDHDDISGRTPPMPGISVERKAKLTPAGFGWSEEEHLVLIRDGELLRGVLDKAAFGSTDFSLVHAVYEAYGPSKAGLLLNSLGRLFTAYLQYFSIHSCRLEDLVLTPEANQKRLELVQRAYNLGSRAAKAWADSEGGKAEINDDGTETRLKPVEEAAAASKIGELLSGNDGFANFAALDGYMQSKLNPLASEIIKACLPNGLSVPFPVNTFSLMVMTGAKGSTVNQSQVSCALGQQALEGRRVPRLASGRTLPSFAPYDPNPRADGFIMDRFLTGIRPQEYFHHCMAGREGLVDTAVKTSRSGYLQRCLVKHLEELKVCYDSTVRNGEGGVIQFLYGEDGLDPTKCAFLDCSSRSFEYIARNHESLSRINKGLPDASIKAAAADKDRLTKIQESPTKEVLTVGSFVKARRLRVGSRWVRGCFCRGWFDATIMAVNDDDTFDIEYLKDGKKFRDVPREISLGRCGGLKTQAVSNISTLIKPAVPDPILSGIERFDGTHRLGQSGLCVSEKVASSTDLALKSNKKLRRACKSSKISKGEFGKLVALKYGAAICAPGEAVGSIAAQGVGEPSTQMTLNTFHLAGSGANVTLGIPRLREIIMSASKNLKTPTMSVPLNDSVTDKQALRLTRYFTKLTLMELISSRNGIVVNETLMKSESGTWERAYHVSLKFHPAERIREAFGLDLDEIAVAVAKSFGPNISRIMKRELRKSSDNASNTVLGGDSTTFTPATSRNSRQQDDVDELEEGDDLDDDDAPGEEDGVRASRNTGEVQGYEMDEEDRDVARKANSDSLFEPNDDEYEMDSSSEAGADPDDKDAEEEETDRSFVNMSHQPKLDRKGNVIHLPVLRVDPAARPLLMVGLVETAASATIVRARPKISKGFINKEENDRGRCLQTAGVNFTEIWKLRYVDHNRLASNDIWAMRCTYGVEAARNNIVEQIRSVFGVYGISIDPRHLGLIADYMTFEGGFKAMNRGGMESTSSPFLQMSFETTSNFMTEAALNSRVECIQSPSANIVVGRPIRHGTGSFDIRVKTA